MSILRVAVPSPLRRFFDYLPPPRAPLPAVGSRVRVPFGRRRVVGIVTAVVEESSVPAHRLRAVEAVLDPRPLLDSESLALLRWAAAYYHHPPGEVFGAALPAPLRHGESAAGGGPKCWRLTAAGKAVVPDQLARAPRQAALLGLLLRHGGGPLEAARIDAEFSAWREPMRRLVEKGWVTVEQRACLPDSANDGAPPPILGPAQREAVAAVTAALDRFGGFLLDGVTGSGKTEVYLQAIARVLAAGRQVLVLVPEIGLTPQLVDRFRRRFPVPVAVLHSGLSDGERLCAWNAAREGEAPILIGTRSAVFAPLPTLGMVIVDEEHDPAYKQQEGFRYSARDVAVMRARHAGVPVVLGSATPSLESLGNCVAGRYTRLCLPERAGTAQHPRMTLLDVRHQPMDEGISEPLLHHMHRHLEAEGQVLLFLNRRGYAPTLLCHDCGWVAHCSRCDAHYTLYQQERKIRCHHCASERPLPAQCPDCGSIDLRPVGQGTERVEQALARHFPDLARVRIDRDATRRKGRMAQLLAQAQRGEARILVGTQMLAKGHHFPGVTLVGILDADQGLFSADFRASERMAQLIIQVAGRAGRAERPGEVVIQTHQPDHPLLVRLVHEGYPAFATAALEEREAAELPPFSHLALLRAEAVSRTAPLAFLEAARAAAEPISGPVLLLGPVPAPMERRAGRYRAQLLLQAEERHALHRLLKQWLPQVEALKSGRQVRWSLDVDPGEMF